MRQRLFRSEDKWFGLLSGLFRFNGAVICGLHCSTQPPEADDSSDRKYQPNNRPAHLKSQIDGVQSGWQMDQLVSILAILETRRQPMHRAKRKPQGGSTHRAKD